MSQSLIHAPGDIVNQVYSQNIPSIIKMCHDAGDDPRPIIEETKRELQVIVYIRILLYEKKKIFF